MSAIAPAGWYPDGQGNERFWDGSVWTTQLRPPETASGTAVADSNSGKEGAFSRLKRVAADKQSERRSAKEEFERKQARDAQAAGPLVTSGVFGTSTVEIYQGGYVRVATGEGNAAAASDITKKTPYERLRSIKFTQPVGGSPGGSSMLEGAVGPAVARLAKGAAGLMKASAPGLAVAGLAHFAGAEGRTSFLTIATDKQIHTLTNKSSNGFVTKSNRGHNAVGLALEEAGISVLDIVDATKEVESSLQPQVLHQAASEPSLAERLRELAVLHKEGVLSDEEFSAAKARLLGGL